MKQDINTLVKDDRYRFIDIAKDCDGDLLGMLEFTYNGQQRDHEFCFLTKTNELSSIDYGWKIPYVHDVFDQIEQILAVYAN